MKKGLKDMIFILNPNLISLSFLENWLFNIVLEPNLTGGLEFEPSLCNLFPIY